MNSINRTPNTSPVHVKVLHSVSSAADCITCTVVTRVTGSVHCHYLEYLREYLPLRDCTCIKLTCAGLLR